MSDANAKKLLEKVSADATLKAQLKAAGTNGFSNFAQSQGLPCTLDEFTAAAKIIATQKLNEKMSAGLDAQIGVGNISII